MCKWALMALACVMLASCRRPPQSGTVVMIIESSPANLDPRTGTDAQSERIADFIFDSLVHRDEHFEMKPWLASSWDISPDGLTYTFHLRDGVRFHDGSPLTSLDVKWTLDSVMSGAVISVKKTALSNLSAVEAPDSKTVILHLKKPDVTLLFNLSNGSLGIVPYGADKSFANKLNGTGPFRFVSQSQDDYVLVDRNPDYWAGPPHVPAVRFIVVPDTTTRVLELRKGSADVEINAVTADMEEAVRDKYSDRLVIERGVGTSLQYVAMNLRDPLLRDARVRQALSCATNVQPIIHYLMRDLARTADSVLPPEHWAYASPQRKPCGTEEAENLLAKAGYPRWKDGVRARLSMKTSTDEFARLLAATLQSQWQRVGVKLDIRSFEFATFYSDVTKGSYQLYSLRWVGGSNQDPDVFSYAFDSSRMPPSGANRSYYSNPELDTLLASARSTINQLQRKLDYARVQQILARDLPYLNLWYMDNVIIHTKRVKNVKTSPAGNYEFLRDIELDDAAR